MHGVTRQKQETELSLTGRAQHHVRDNVVILVVLSTMSDIIESQREKIANFTHPTVIYPPPLGAMISAMYVQNSTTFILQTWGYLSVAALHPH